MLDHPLTRRVGLALTLCLVLAGCFPPDLPTPLATPPVIDLPAQLTQVATAQPDPQPAVQAYFTDPDDPAANRALEEAVAASLDGARETIEMAMYNFSLDSAGEALLRAIQRGVRVRVVLDSDAMDGRWAARLKDGGAEVLGDRRETLMHNKFILIDGLAVWTGSLNLTTSGLNEDENNFVLLRSTDAAADYTRVFDQMFDKDRFSIDRPAGTPHPVVSLDGARARILFSPEDRPAADLTELIQSADRSIEVLAYNLTLDDLAAALIAREKAGVRVRILMDAGQSDAQGGEYQKLRQAGLDVRLYGGQGLMHHKVIIVDGRTVAFGSLNFTRSADRNNDENVVILEDSLVAAQFQAAFERIARR